MITTLKASAGSGKTFRLTQKYLMMLLSSSSSHPWRHILAVTFTNKATAEMKKRILDELDTLVYDPSASPYATVLETLPGGLKGASEKAASLLPALLYDYGSFSVSTIDSFFQKTLRAFAREAGRKSSYEVELDKNELVRCAVDALLDSMTEQDTALLRWLTGNAVARISRGERFNLESDLYDMGQALLSDEHRAIVRESGMDESEAYSADNLIRVRAACYEIMDEFTGAVRKAASAVNDVLVSTGVNPADSNRGFLAKIPEYYMTVREDETITAPTLSWMDKASDSEKWFPKKNAHLLTRTIGLLDGPLNTFCSLFEEPYRKYRTAQIISSQVFGLGIAESLYKAFDAMSLEKNVISIDDGNTILRDILGGGDVPFVYEKTGSRYDRFLLDEFQDTSSVQWENIKPLIEESEAAGGETFIVGDVKQSIYRWRNSDWNLLKSGVARDFPASRQDAPLTENWRSCRGIVRFNNALFEMASALLDRQLGTGVVSEIYADAAQVPMSKDPNDGLVRVVFTPREDELAAVSDTVADVLRRGARPGDIAVLVRNNADGSAVASWLTAKGYRVVSYDSLRVKASPLVRRLTSVLSLGVNPDDQVAGYLARELGVTVPESVTSIEFLSREILAKMQESDPVAFTGQAAYVQAFLDDAADWTATYGNNLPGFLKHWSESDPRLSSPSSADAIRVSTIHKAKGLEWPVVIFPFAEKVTLFRSAPKWLSTSSGKGAESGMFDIGACRVDLNAGSESTDFADAFRKEKAEQYVDNINAFYVAMTRARNELHVIAEDPSTKKARPGETESNVNDFAKILYMFIGENRLGGKESVAEDGSLLFGTRYPFTAENSTQQEENPFVLQRTVSIHPSRGRLRLRCPLVEEEFAAESQDDVSEDGSKE